MTFSPLRLIAAFPLTLALIGSACAVPVSGAGTPFQADLPAGWAQRVIFKKDMQALKVTAPGKPSPVILVFISVPFTSTGDDTQELKNFVEGSEKGAINKANGEVTITRLSERPLTVGGVRGIERQYNMTVKDTGEVILKQVWYGIGLRNLLQFGAATGKGVTPAQAATFDKVLSTVKFK